MSSLTLSAAVPRAEPRPDWAGLIQVTRRVTRNAGSIDLAAQVPHL
ncbi:hypothetical protein [Streptacidiphilus sp. P02-A3a]|nr:hypothetical protein [Streptacidiphilus sp. P02-A3a]QMU71866.1 hypothetical protein GXP74_30160 [Streptacidiphilus sp. P02-A3a]